MMSKGLEALKLIPRGWIVEDTKNGKNYDGDKLIKIIEKELKALEIIKKKCLTNCNLALVKDNVHYSNYCKEFEYFLNKYNESPNGFEITKEDLLIKGEFDLLREVFINE